MITRLIACFCLVAISICTSIETVQADEADYLRVVDYEQFIRLSPSAQNQYIEMLRGTIVELAAQEQGSEYEYFNGSSAQTGGGRRSGYAFLLAAFGSEAEAQIEAPGLPRMSSYQYSREMTEAEYNKQKEQIEKRPLVGYGRAGISADRVSADRATKDAELKALKEKYDAGVEAAKTRKTDTAKIDEKALELREEAAKARLKAANELPRGYGRGGVESDKAFERRQADQRAAAQAPPMKISDQADPATAGAPPSPPVAPVAPVAPNAAALPTFTSSTIAPPSMAVSPDAKLCIGKPIRCSTTDKDRKKSEIAYANQRPGCVYGGWSSTNLTTGENKVANHKKGNCKPPPMEMSVGNGRVVRCPSGGPKNQILCNPMLFGTVGPTEGTNSVIEGRCVARTRTVTGDCDVALRRAKKRSPGEKEFWQMQFDGSANLFDESARQINYTCENDAIRNHQCNECAIIQRRLAVTKMITRRCSWPATNDANQSTRNTKNLSR